MKHLNQGGFNLLDNFFFLQGGLIHLGQNFVGDSLYPGT